MKKSKAVAVIQARMESTRLPGKSLLNLAGKPLIEHVIERTAAIDGLSAVILAIPDTAENDVLEETAKKCRIDFFRGSPDDVLARYYLAALPHSCGCVVRVTGDNPFTDTGYASISLRKSIEADADNFGLTGLPLGTGVEIISMRSLEAAYIEAAEPHQREHVSPYIKEHPERFRVLRKESGLDREASNLRLTVDTAVDFELAAALSEALYRGKPYPVKDILSYLKDHPGLVSINSSVEQRPMTHSAG